MSSTAGLQVRFSLEPKQKGGEWVNVEYIRIIPLADKFNAPHRPVEPEDKVRFAAQYEAWKRGLVEPAKGQPLKTWPGITPAEVNVLAQAGISTVEALAGAPDGMVGLDGPYLALRDAARRYLDLSASTSALQQLEAKVAEKDAELLALRERLAEAERPHYDKQPQQTTPDAPGPRGRGRPRKAASSAE
jgi:hypothetical protein